MDSIRPLCIQKYGFTIPDSAPIKCFRCGEEVGGVPGRHISDGVDIHNVCYAELLKRCSDFFPVVPIGNKVCNSSLDVGFVVSCVPGIKTEGA